MSKPTFHCGNKPEDGSNLKESDGIPEALVTSPQAMQTKVMKCQHGLPPGFCRECAKFIADTMREQAARLGIGVVDVTLQENIEPEDLFGIPRAITDHERIERKTREFALRYGRPTSEEMENGPMPPWAIGYAKGELVLGAQLPTRDGRRCGNAHIVNWRIGEISDEAWSIYTLLTDAGSTMEMMDGEVTEQFYPPVWVSNVEDVWRKFGPELEDLTGFPNPEDLVDTEQKFANSLTMGERRRNPSSYGMKNLYHWSSKLLEAHSQGDIIVMAENVEQARDKVYATFDPLEDGGPFEDSYLQMLAMNRDEDYMTEYMKSLNVLREDLNKEPTIVPNDVVLIRGSD